MSKKPETSALFTKEALQGMLEAVPTKVHIPELNGDVFLKAMSAFERVEYEEIAQTLLGTKEQTEGQESKAPKDPKDVMRAMIHLLVRTVTDEAGVPILSEADIETLGKKSVKAVKALFTVAEAHN